MDPKINKRLLNEIKRIKEDPSKGIWLEQVDDSIVHFKALIMGLDGPYHGGFFLFDIDCSKDYPYSPPKVKIINTCDNIRIHPNLYGNGNVCLSLLGTWGQNTWTCVQDIKSVLINLQVLVCMDHPIQGEPNYEKSTNPEYSKYVSHACAEQFMYNPLFDDTHRNLYSDYFKSVMKNEFLENRERYIKFLSDRISENKENTSILSGQPYSKSILPNYNKIKIAFIDKTPFD